MKKQSMSKVFLICGIVLFAGVLSAKELLTFDNATFRIEGRKNKGIENTSLTPSAKNGTVLRWKSPTPSAIELALVSPASPKIPLFEKALFTLNAEFPKELRLRRIVFRMQDAKGEIFQFSNRISGNFSGKMKLEYTLSEGSAESSWGRNKNKKIDWPLSFYGLAIDTNRNTDPNGEIILKSLEYQVLGEALKISLDCGHPLKLLLPERKSPPALTFCNTGSEKAVLGGILRIEDFSGKIHASSINTTLPAGEKVAIPIPGDFSMPNWWKLQYNLVSAAGKKYSGEHRFARMIPAGPTAERATGFLFGICSHPERFGMEKAQTEALAAGLCGAKIMRIDFSWGRIQPQPTRWNFATYDSLVSLLKKQGIEVQAILGFSVKWAVPPDFKPKNATPKFATRGTFADPALYAVYCGKVAEHYKDSIRYFELWNEPDLVIFANFEFEKYMELLRAGSSAIRKISADARIMNGGMASAWTNTKNDPLCNNGWMQILKKDQGKHFDIFAFHGHGPYTDYTKQLNLLKQNGIIGKSAPRPWYSNETAETSARIGEAEQAVTLYKKILTAWANGAIGYNWYNLREKGELYAVGHHERHFGLITTDFEPKPAYLVFNMLAGTYRNARFQGETAIAPGITAYRFLGEKGEGLAALWSNLQKYPQTVMAKLPSGTVKVDLFGKETPVELRDGFAYLTLSSTPFTLKTPPGKEKEIQISSGYLAQKTPMQFFLEPGKSHPISIEFVNPTGKTLTLHLKTVLPNHVSIKPAVRSITLKAGEKQSVKYHLLATTSFSASPASPVNLLLKVMLEGSCVDTLVCSLARRPAANEPLFLLNQPGQYHSLVPSAPGNEAHYWKGAGDLSARIYFFRKGEKVHLKAEVTDDRHVQTHTGKNIWKGDSIQFGIRLPGQNGVWKIGLARLSDGKSEVVCWNRPAGAPDPSVAIRLTTWRDEKKKLTAYHAEIPLSLFGESVKSGELACHFNLIVNDNDGPLREGYLAVAPGMGTEENPFLWTPLTL